MNKNELKEKIREINLKSESEILKLKRDFCFKQTPYKIGDIVRDHYHTIKIERITYHTYDCCLYHGVELKNDLTPKKRQTHPYMYQKNIVEKLT